MTFIPLTEPNESKFANGEQIRLGLDPEYINKRPGIDRAERNFDEFFADRRTGSFSTG